VREALSHLVPDGLVTAQGQRGYTVAPISIVDLEDLSNVRTMLETYALRESIAHGDDEWEASIVAAFHRLTKAQRALDDGEPGAVADWEARNHDFHDALTSACHSRWVHHMLDMLHHHSERYRRMALTDRSVPRDVHTEHQQLMDAALERDADRATAVVADHIRRTAEVIAVLHSDRIESVGTDDAA
jgi:DNA-binding GntR family transcriptional regulator